MGFSAAERTMCDARVVQIRIYSNFKRAAAADYVATRRVKRALRRRLDQTHCAVARIILALDEVYVS